VAEKFAAEGCNLAINYLFSQDQANTLATELANKHGINAVTIQGVRIPRESDKSYSMRKIPWFISDTYHQIGRRCCARLCAAGSDHNREIERAGYYHLECCKFL
jgi:hypothetical protein